MRVKINIRTKEQKERKKYSTVNKSYTLKDAKELAKVYAEDDNIVDVFITHFATWHNYLVCYLKKDGKKGYIKESARIS